MDISLIVERTLDVGICLAILTDKDIFEAISEDTATLDDLRVDVLTDYWLNIELDKQSIGVVQFKRMFNKCFEAHIHILPEFRKDHSINAGQLILIWCKENIQGSLLYTTVPEFCPNVKNWLVNFGFIEQGILPKAWFKHGQQNDMTILTREV